MLVLLHIWQIDYFAKLKHVPGILFEGWETYRDRRECVYGDLIWRVPFITYLLEGIMWRRGRDNNLIGILLRDVVFRLKFISIGSD